MPLVELWPLRSVRDADRIGQKARNLGWLARHGWRVPLTFILPFPAAAQDGRASDAWRAALRRTLSGRLDLSHAYAVRSSANVEDQAQRSFAGQFLTQLDVHGLDAMLDAVQAVLTSGQAPGLQAYLQQSRQPPAAVRVAVILQPMLTPRVSGVAFSHNPLTGLSEAVVEAVQGSGAALVQDGVTPARWVYKWGDWIRQPDASPIDSGLIRQVAAQVQHMARAFGAPVDVEWVYDGHELYWIQLRPITRLEQPNLYSNRISREVFPGLIKPLVWSINVPLVNSAWIRLFTQMIGPNDLQPEALSRAFAYRAYFNMGTIGRIFSSLGFPRETLELLLGLEGGADRPRFRPTLQTWRHLPRLLGLAARLWGFGSQVPPTLEALRQAYRQLRPDQLAGRPDADLLAEIDQLQRINQRAAYQNIVVPLLMNAYSALLLRQLAALGVDPARVDPAQGLAGLAEFDPKLHLARLSAQFHSLDALTQARIRASSFAEFQHLPGLADFQGQVANFLAHFGHLSDSGNDFSSVPWREQPDLVLAMITADPDGHRPAPPHRAFDTPPAASDARAVPGRMVTWDELQVRGPRRWLLRLLYERARAFRLHREAVSSLYTYGYGLFRTYFLELGRRLVRRGLLDAPEDTFLLYWSELQGLFPGTTEDTQQARRLAAARREEMRASAELVLPELIYGDQTPPGLSPDAGDGHLRGIPSSRGYYSGPARVIRSVAEFNKLIPGDVLIIPYSDVSWTLLFARAGAVIAESGGILSHSSIVAREYNLPCVVSVPGACQIADGTRVAVDGYTGQVILR